MNIKNVLIIISVLCLLLIIVIITPALGSYPNDYKIIEVENGDSLWKIAKENGPKYQDIRKTIYYIKKYNNLNTSYIYEGQKLKVPIY